MLHFTKLEPRPADALLGLMAAYREDDRSEKVDLGPGIYKNSAGETPVMSAVKKAEALILKQQQTKAYEGPRGNEEFCRAIETLLLGANHSDLTENRILSYMTPGGCGGLYLGIELMKRLGAQRIWMSQPSWPNHLRIAQTVGLEPLPYAYAENGEVAWHEIAAALNDAAPGDGIIVQGPCHNPTGIDLSKEQYRSLAELCKEKGLIPLVDFAYHGFGKGLEADSDGVRTFLEASEEALLAYSCSKNFGLYRDRTGCFLAKGDCARTISAIGSHIADIARTSYSMPPAHGAAIVATILNDPALRGEWQDELNGMRTRIVGLRQALSNALVEATGRLEFRHLASQNGMFSQVPITPEATVRMREDHALYVPASGRINIAGLSGQEIDHVAKVLSEHL